MTPTELLTNKFLKTVCDLFYSYIDFFPEERSQFQILEKQFEDRDRQLCNRKNLTGHLTASGILLHPDGQSVFLIYHNFLKLWLQPGGHLDHEEDPAGGAIREFIEETGIETITLHPWHDQHPFPFDIDTHAIPVNEKKNEGSHFHHDFQYLLTRTSEQEEPLVKLDATEVSSYKWFSLTEIINGDHDVRLKRGARKISQFHIV